MAASNHIIKVAVVGAGGNIGSFITEALLRTGKHAVTAITRFESQSTFPADVNIAKVDYNKAETIVESLKGHDALVITLSGTSPKETEMQLIHAAGDAGVPWILPNDWSPDTTNEAMVKDVVAFQPKVDVRKAIEDLNKSSYIALSTGFWYEWSLAMPAAFGLDLANRTAILFDEGESKISTSTWPQIGRAVAALLSLPIKPKDSHHEEDCLENFKNRVVHIKSFTVSQREMLESAMRVTSTAEKDWTITKEPSHQRYATGIKEIQDGNHSGFPKMVARIFYPDGCGDFEHNKGTLNRLLNLPEEDIDEATKIAIARSKALKKG